MKNQWLVRLSLIFSLMLLFAGVILTVNAHANDPALVSQELVAAERTPLQVGQIEQAQLSFSYTQLEAGPRTIRYPGASYIKVHIAGLDLMPGDTLTVSDPAGSQVYEYPGSLYTTDESGGFWAISIQGDTALVALRQSGGQVSLDSPVFEGVYDKALAGNAPADLGVMIDKYARGFPLAEIESLILGTESTCGSNQRTDVACYQSSHPTEFNKSHAVARILIDNTYLCTAWRASSLNRVFTNEHCITSQSDVDGTEVWFNYQRTTCGGSLGTTTIVTGDDFLTDSYNYDFALFTVNNFNNISSFGYLDIDPRTPVLNEEIYIPQHGNGDPKQFGIESDMNTGNVCRIDDAVRTGIVTDSDTGYFCDTVGGSSGSPVLARSNHKVIAIHHFGTGGAACNSSTMNQGVRMDLIWPMVDDFFPTNVGPVVYEDHHIDDDNSGNSSGNNNGVANCGETIELYVDLLNQGAATATGVSATLSSGDSYVSFPANTTSAYPDIPGGVSRTNSDDYEVTINPSTPNGHVVAFSMTVNASNGGPWYTNFNIPVTCTPNEPDLWLSSTQLSNSQMPNQVVTRQLTLGNNGLQTLNWQIYEQLADSAPAGTAPAGTTPAVSTPRSDILVDPLSAYETYTPSAAQIQASPAEPSPIISAPHPESVLYDNGPFINSPGTGFAGADESMLQNLTLGMNILGVGHQYDNNNRIADDFTVSAAGGWDIDTITFYDYQTGSTTISPITHINLRIWNGKPGAGGSVIWGDTTTNRMTGTGWSGAYRVTEDTSGNIDRPIMASMVAVGLHLPQGTYWLDWQADGSATYTGPWAPPITINGSTTTGNAIQYLSSSGTWQDVLDEDGTNTQQGFPFVIQGSLAITECKSQNVPWLSVSPLSGSITSGGSSSLDVSFNSNGMSDGLYEGELCIESNDPDENPFVIPVTLEVTSKYKTFTPMILKNN